uniref:Zona pellucida sperm-binding protein 4 n=1 Tax=Hucho hucho TaxID=62062 RepID=A0A4W5RK33_9TELE
MAVRWCSYRFVMLVVFACYADAQPNWRFPSTNNPQPQVKPRQPQWPEPQWPQQKTPQKPQQRTPQRPESQGPQLQNPQWSKLLTPQGPQLLTPQSPEPQGAHQQTPQRPESQGPQQQTPQRREPQWPQPHGPQLQNSQWPQLQTPQWPQLQNPQRPEPHTPQLQTPQRPQPQGPQLQTPQGPQLQTPQRPEPQGPQLQTPQGPQLQTPQGPLLQTPQGPEPQGPQLQTPQRPQLLTSEGPQLQTPQGPQLQTPQGPLLQTPQGPEPQGPQLQTPQGPEPQGPQLQTAQGPEPQGPHKQTPQWPAVTKTQNQRCQVEAKDTVQCGTPKITLAQCEAIDCCFNGQQCYYGKAGEHLIDFLPCNALLCHLPWWSCPLTVDSPLQEENGYLVYENRMASSYEVGIVPQGAITRDSQFELLFQCKYSDTAVKALVIEVNTAPPPAPVAVMGPLRVELRLAKGTCDTKTCKDESSAFTSFYTEEDYPLTKVLRQPVYVEVHILEKKDPNLVLMLEHCWTTSDPSPVSMPQWDLLIEKCSYQNDQYQTTMVPVELSSGLLYPSHYKRFILKMFTFVDHTLAPRKDIFIHCSASLCYPTPWYSCEPKCNKQRRDVATVAWRKTRQTAVVSSGEVVLVDKKPA